MEPVTHVLTGACLARAGLNRRAAYATVAMAIAAELPDIDTVWSVRGPVESFAHHRGMTHTFLGFPIEAAILVGAIYVWHRLRGQKPQAAPVRWGALYGFVLLALCSHILLDWTNNYGVRPFFPFNRHWYAGSFVFIFDPYIFLALLAGVVLPPLFGLVGREVSGKKRAFSGTGWPAFALVVVVLMWSFRAIQHSKALDLAMGQSYERQVVVGAPDQANLAPPEEAQMMTAQRALASPDPLSFFRWYTVTDFGPLYQLGVADLSRGTISAGIDQQKLAPTPAILAAERSRLGQVYLDWSPMPFVNSVRSEDGGTTVTFSDPRFMGETPLLHSAKPPLVGTVTLDSNGLVVEQEMNGSIQKQTSEAR